MGAHSHQPNAWGEEVRTACAARGLSLTPARAGVVAILSDTPGPLGAYAIIEALAKRENKSIAPPTVYRALDFLLEHGFVHRIESRNAFARCAHFGHEHRCLLMTCETCGRSVEIEDESVGEAVEKAALAAGFTPKGRVVEVAGLCAACAGAA